MSLTIPPSRPQITRAEVLADLQPFNIDRGKYPLIVVTYPGYYKRTMGDPTKNDRNYYDDAIIVDDGNEIVAFNANTDPTASEGAITGRATLAPGFHPMWRLDLHKGQYLALCQRAASCIVKRDNTEDVKKGTKHATWGECLGNGLWRGWFGINCHRGGLNTTSSEGCQTIPPIQYDGPRGFIVTVEKRAKAVWSNKWKEGVIPAVCIVK